MLVMWLCSSVVEQRHHKPRVVGSNPTTATNIIMKYFLYILKSLKDKNYYVGVTENITKRLKEHNSGFSKSTKHRRPFIIVHNECFDDISSAYKREKFIKSKKSKKIIEIIINNKK